MSSTAISPTALQALDEPSRKEIMKFIESEQQKSKIQTSIHNFTDMCFKKCNQNKVITNPNLDLKEEQCLVNCLNRFLDLNIKVVEALQRR
ncbi:TIM8 [Candida pseudojiufengensis]|uniref:TIM8 n=1 Tax=Candida pseudojiufengensis TaxID=497109 RepID=UPI00222403A1|nr:TIM8 [Candida pseudojiufengensis]KAI5965150.1 TIM8 [Candida pseudojiufengensis]